MPPPFPIFVAACLAVMGWAAICIAGPFLLLFRESRWLGRRLTSVALVGVAVAVSVLLAWAVSHLAWEWLSQAGRRDSHGPVAIALAIAALGVGLLGAVAGLVVCSVELAGRLWDGPVPDQTGSGTRAEH